MTDRLTMREKLSYGFGNFGINLQFGMTGAFLMYFYTDVYRIDAAAVGTLFLVARGIDALFDPLMGLLIDRTRTRWGKHRPYLIALAVPFALAGVAVFAMPALEGNARIAYIYLSYTLVGILYSAVSLPLNSMLPTLTRDPKERNVTNSTREFMGTGAVVGVGYITLPLVGTLGGGSASKGFLMAAALFGLISMVALLVAFLNTRERVAPVVSPTTLTTRQSLSAARGNWPWIATMLVNFFFWIGFSGHVQSVVYYAQHVLGRAGLVPDLMLTMIAVLAGTGISGWCANRIGKRLTGVIGSAIAVAGTALIPLSNDTAWLLAMNSLAYLGMGLIGGLLFSLMADAVDYGEWRSGFRAQGFLFAASSFGVKLGMSVGGAIGAWLLSYSGYVAGAPITAEVAASITWGHAWMPAIAFAAMGASLLLFVFEPAYRNRDILSEQS
jgi:GPH family glycoside/pentoside/hexuronide:cation symporter